MHKQQKLHEESSLILSTALCISYKEFSSWQTMEQQFDINLLALNPIRPKRSSFVKTIAALRTWVK